VNIKIIKYDKIKAAKYENREPKEIIYFAIYRGIWKSDSRSDNLNAG